MSRRGQAEAYPVQRVPKRPRILILLAAIIVTLVLSTLAHVKKVDVLYVAKGRDAVGRLQQNIKEIPRPFSHLHNPFRPQAHPPPVQKNSTWGDASWFSDWKWLNPFSSTVTLDEDRALLPPLDQRPPVYTYYEARDEKTDAVLRAAEDRLLEVWRRAWWAQGFKPVVLGPAEALENPLYQKLQAVNATRAVEMELMRWLAWSHMGDGILANWLAVPMAEYYQPTLANLRSARYTELTRYLDLQLGLFTGAKKEIDKALNVFLDAQAKRPYATLMNAIEENEESGDLFRAEVKGKGVAFYSESFIKAAYPAVGSLLSEQQAKGLHVLADLITAHLHATFLAKYPDGIAVVSPYARNATVLPHRALTVAESLNACPDDPTIPGSKLTTCPPNLNRESKCVPCKEVPLLTPSAAPNSTTVFTLGTVPNPYTLSLLMAPHDAGFNFSVPYIRRRTERDPFIEAVTADKASKGISSLHHIMQFKESVAQPGKGAMRSIWKTAEADWEWETLEWQMGFALARPAEPDVSDAQGLPVPQKTIGLLQVENDAYPKSLEPILKGLRAKPEVVDLIRQEEIIKSAAESLGKKKWSGTGSVDMRKVCESWHLADTEAWRFVRALQAREEMERRQWQDEERRFRH